jgi:hypothetical protein
MTTCSMKHVEVPGAKMAYVDEGVGEAGKNYGDGATDQRTTSGPADLFNPQKKAEDMTAPTIQSTHQ